MVGPVDLDDHHTRCGEHPRKLGAVGPSAFDANSGHRSSGAHPVQEATVAARIGRELPVIQMAAQISHDVT